MLAAETIAARLTLSATTSRSSSPHRAANATRVQILGAQHARGAWTPISILVPSTTPQSPTSLSLAVREATVYEPLTARFILSATSLIITCHCNCTSCVTPHCNLAYPAGSPAGDGPKSRFGYGDYAVALLTQGQVMLAHACPSFADTVRATFIGSSTNDGVLTTTTATAPHTPTQV